MTSITLTNIPRSELLPDNNSRGAYVYPFYDQSLAHLYHQLTPPAADFQIPFIQNGFGHPALTCTWFDVRFNHYEIGPVQRWPFETTRILDHCDDEAPTDRGLLDPGDLGDEVESLIPSAPSNNRTANTASTTSPAVSTVNKPPLGNIRSRKFLLDVPADLRAVFRDWNAAYIKTFNEAARMVNLATDFDNDNLSEFELYRLLVNNSSPLVVLNRELDLCPSVIRRGAVDDAVRARKALLSRFGARAPSVSLKPIDPSRPFCFNNASDAGFIRPQWRDPLDPSQRQYGPKLQFYPKILKQRGVSSVVDIRLRGQKARRWLVDRCERKEVRERVSGTKQWVPVERFCFPREWQLQLDRYGDFYAILQYRIPESKYVKEHTLHGPLLVRTLDPNVRTAFAVWSSDGTTIDIGNEHDRDRLKVLRLAMDRLRSAQNRRQHSDSHSDSNSDSNDSSPFYWPSKIRRRFRLRRRRLAKQHRQLVDNLHQRLANYLATTSDVIVMPRMEVRSMIRRRGRSLHWSTKRQLMAWAHCAFLNRLIIKCHDVAHDHRYPHKAGRPTVILVQPEPYTSKTCPACGNLNQRLGSNKNFRCPSCAYHADRDHNGAFNMILRAIRSPDYVV